MGEYPDDIYIDYYEKPKEFLDKEAKE